VTEFVFLHGLTFHHRMWEPVLAALPEGTAAIAPDLPGHGGAPLLEEAGLAPVAEHVHEAVAAAGFERPVVVGHSIGGPIATIYAGGHPAAGVVTLDASMRFEPFAAGLQALRHQLEGPDFDAGWAPFRDSMHIERVSDAHRHLVRVGERASQEVVLHYQADLLRRPLADVVAERDAGMAVPGALCRRDRPRGAGVVCARASARGGGGVARRPPLPAPRAPGAVRRALGGVRPLGG
jgi:pimeloyl-ACP methyl ester carboxylesterase